MTKLTRKNMRQVHDALDKTRFSSAAFDVQFPKDGILIYSVRLPATTYFFTLENDNVIRYAPGHNIPQQAEGGYDFQDSLNSLINWVGFVHEEISVVLPGEASGDDLFKLFEKFSENQDPEHAAARFDFAEVADLTKKLEDLEAKLNDLVDKHELTEESLISLREAISNAKEDLPNVPKQVWYRIAAAKIATTTKQVIISKEGRAIAYESAKKMLGLD